MPHSENHTTTVTFRLDHATKSKLTRLAKRDHRSLGALLRELAHERVIREQQRVFELEARRQSLEAAEAARDPESDEAKVMRELEDDLAEFADEWN